MCLDSSTALRADRRLLRPARFSGIRVFAASSILALASLALSAAAGFAADRVALVIGNGSYSAPLQKLDACPRDAAKMAAAFEKIGIRVYGGKPRINLNADQMDAALNEFVGSVGKDSEVFIYYSGHGAQIGGSNYLLPVGFNARFESQARRQAVSLDAILDLLEKTESRLRVVILDACRDSGEFLPGEPTQKGLYHTKGLSEQKVDAPETLVCFATKHGTAALADDTASYYTRILAEEIVKPGKVEDVMKVVARRVIAETDNKQYPFTYGNLLHDHFFAPGSAPTETPDVESEVQRRVKAELAKFEQPKPPSIETHLIPTPMVEDTRPKAGTERIRRKLDRIIIPKLEFREATIREALDYLKKKSVELDVESRPGEKGVNIVLKLESAEGADVPALAAIPGIPGLEKSAAPAAAPTAPPTTGAPADARITVSLTNIPLIEALKYVTKLANLKLNIEPFAVFIVPQTENTDVMATRESKIPEPQLPARGFFPLDQIFNGSPYSTYSSTSRSRILRKAQNVLKSHGFLSAEPDGKPGRETEKAIIDYQRERNLPITGRLDSETVSSLGLGSLEETVPPTPIVKPKPAVTVYAVPTKAPGTKPAKANGGNETHGDTTTVTARPAPSPTGLQSTATQQGTTLEALIRANEQLTEVLRNQAAETPKPTPKRADGGQ